jgi:hypothetical protein
MSTLTSDLTGKWYAFREVDGPWTVGEVIVDNQDFLVAYDSNDGCYVFSPESIPREILSVPEVFNEELD